MALSKVRVQLLNEKTGEVIEEVDVLTSPDSVLFADGKTLTQVLEEIETTPGEKGDKGTSLRTRGAWAPSTAYVANQQYIDIVSKDGTAYACKASHTSTSTWDASKWMVLVERGPAGAPGATTADGVSYGNKSVKEVLDDLLYTAIQLTAFTNNVNTVEMGTTVNTVRLDWNYNKTPKTLTLDNAQVDVSTKTKTIEGAGIKTNKTYDNESALFYADPPYYNAEKYYPDRFNGEDHQRLYDCLDKIKGRFILSYNDCPEIRNLYQKFNIEYVERQNNLVRDKGRRYGELIIKNF